MKLIIVLAFVFHFILKCWPETNDIKFKALVRHFLCFGHVSAKEK